MAIDHGGPAFPYKTKWQETIRDGGIFGEWKDEPGQWRGMSLRDWFAGQALIGIVVKGYQPAYAGQLAYEFADDMLDAMLKAREDGQ